VIRGPYVQINANVHEQHERFIKLIDDEPLFQLISDDFSDVNCVFRLNYHYRYYWFWFKHSKLHFNHSDDVNYQHDHVFFPLNDVINDVIIQVLHVVNVVHQ
jgi:hypothetical protein